MSVRINSCIAYRTIPVFSARAYNGVKHMRDSFGRILPLVRSGFLALLLTVIVGAVWTVLLVGNLASTPAIPWSVVVMALLLWLVWRYFGGTRDMRRRVFRVRQVSVPVFAWSVVAGGLSIVALAGLWIVLFRLVKVPGNALPDYSQYPLFTVALVLTMASFVTSLAEEAAFRGYFQSIMERAVRAPVAIIVAALVIAPGHGLTQGFVWTTLLFYLFVDVTFGVMAYLTASILPGIAVHTLGLLIFFTLIWPRDTTRRLIGEGGADGWFWIHVTQTIVFAVLAALAFRHLAKISENIAAAEREQA